MAEPDIKLLIGALGGSSASGESAVQIRKELEAALKDPNGIKISVGLSDASKSELKKQIQEQVSGANQQTGASKAQAASIRTNINLKRAEIVEQKKLTTEEEKTTRAIANGEKAQARFNQYLKTVSPKGIREYAAQIENINELFANRDWAKAQTEVTKLSATFKSLGYEGGNVFTYLQAKVKTFTTYLASSALTMAFVISAREAVSAVKEIDAALTQLQIVTGASQAKMEQFMTNSAKLAKNLGQSVTDALGSIETFSRLGYAIEDASELANYAGILSNVANVDLSEATTGLTSIIKGYNMAVSDAEHVADVLVKVGQSYAVSASELLESYEKAGAALNASGTSFEKSAGLIAAANAAVQDSGVVGTAIKTISSRIRGKHIVPPRMATCELMLCA